MPSIIHVAPCRPPEGHRLDLRVRRADRESTTVDLIRRMRDPSCLAEERHRLRELAVRLNLSYARHYGRGYRNRGESLADLQQVAALALVKAIDGYDPDRGSSFTGYATPTVLGELKRHFRDRVWSLHVPRALQETSLAVTRARSELTQRLQRTPSTADIAAHLDLPEQGVRAAEASVHAYHADSLHLPVRSDDSCCELQDLLGAPDEALESVCDRMTLRAHIDRLPAHARYVLDRYYYGNRTQAQIAQELGASQMSVSRLLASTLATLREAFAQERPGPNAKPDAGHPASSCRISDTPRECIVVPSTAALDEAGVADLREVLLDVVMARRPRMLIVDLRHVRQAPARIVRVLVDAYRAGGTVGSRLGVVNLTPELHRLLTKLAVTRLFLCTTRTATAPASSTSAAHPAILSPAAQPGSASTARRRTAARMPREVRRPVHRRRVPEIVRIAASPGVPPPGGATRRPTTSAADRLIRHVVAAPRRRHRSPVIEAPARRRKQGRYRNPVLVTIGQEPAPPVWGSRGWKNGARPPPCRGTGTGRRRRESLVTTTERYVMHQSRKIRQWIVIMTVAIAVAACGGQDPDADEIPNLQPEVGTEQSPEITDITEDAFGDAHYVGQTVTVTGKVTRIITPTSFVLTGDEYDDDSILVLSAKEYDPELYDPLTVTGEVQRFEYPNYRGYELDDEDSYVDFNGREFIVAGPPRSPVASAPTPMGS